MPAPNQFTIIAADTPYAGRCSRSQAQDLGERRLAAIWNGIEFVYCSRCRVKIEATA